MSPAARRCSESTPTRSSPKPATTSARSPRFASPVWLLDTVQRARRYGREPIAGLLDGPAVIELRWPLAHESLLGGLRRSFVTVRNRTTGFHSRTEELRAEMSPATHFYLMGWHSRC